MCFFMYLSICIYVKNSAIFYTMLYWLPYSPHYVFHVQEQKAVLFKLVSLYLGTLAELKSSTLNKMDCN